MRGWRSFSVSIRGIALVLLLVGGASCGGASSTRGGAGAGSTSSGQGGGGTSGTTASTGSAGGASTGGAGTGGDGGIGPDPYADPTCAGLTLDPWQRDADGWTVLPAITQPGRRVIYVSAKNAGKTSPDPMNPDVYYATTPEAGVALLRAGQPDSLLFNRGETFHLQASISSHGLNGGSSIADAKVIGAYGAGPRPVIMWNQPHSIIAVENYTAQYVIITQLDLEPDPSLTQQGTGMTLSATTLAHVLVEDCKIDGFQKGMDLESGTDVVVRRSEIVRSCGGARAQGIYVQGFAGITFDENYMDQNGLTVCGDPTSGSGEGQGIYVQSFNACFRARGNVLSRSLGNTLEARIGGDVVGNVFIGSATAMNYGLAIGGSVETKVMPRGVYGKVTGNVFVNNQVGVQFGNVAQALFSHNVIAATVPVVGALYVQSNVGIGVHGLAVSDNDISAAKYFVSYQSGLPPGPVIMRNDGVNTQVSNCDGAFGAADFSWNGVLVFQYESTTKVNNQTCQVGLEMNGADIYTDASPSTKVIDSADTGIIMQPSEAPVHFGAPNALSGNNVTWTKAPFEEDTTALMTNPAMYFPEMGDDLMAKFANPKASIADVLGSEQAFYDAMAAQSRDAWNPKITAAAVIPYFQQAYQPVP